MLTTLCRSQLSDRNNDFPFHNAATGKVDCNIAQVSQCVELVTGIKLTAAQTRVIGHQPAGPSGNVLARRVLAAQGLALETEYRMFWLTAVQTVRDLLKSGWFVVLYIDYGVMNQLAPDKTGDKNYTGYHAIAVSDFWRGRGGALVHYHDPVNDGRHANTPKGVQTVKFSAVRDAAVAYATKTRGAQGMVQGYAVKPLI
jgi:hypothetical protein